MDETRMFSRLIRFETHCSREMLESMKGLPADQGHTFKLFAHVLESQIIWLARLSGEEEVNEKWWPHLGYEGCRELQQRAEKSWDDFLAGMSLESLGRKVSYRLGNARAGVIVRDILVQLFVHASYLRGQIALEMRGSGINPPLPNYLGFSRLDGQ